ncbi:11875_t:CDS:2, partial [Acaulospora morrowiae]
MLPPPTLRVTELMSKENLPRVPARRISCLPTSGTLKRATNKATNPGVHSLTTKLTGMGGLPNSRKGTSNQPSLVKPFNQQFTTLSKNKHIKLPTGLNRSVAPSRNNPITKVGMTLSRIKLTGNKTNKAPQETKLKQPIRLFSNLQSTSTPSARRTTRVNATNLNRPLRSRETPKSAMRRTTINVPKLPTAAPSRKMTNVDPLRKPVNAASSRI